MTVAREGKYTRREVRQKARVRERGDGNESIKRAGTRQKGAICKSI